MSQYNASNVESMTPNSFNPYDQRNYFLMTSGMATRRMMWETENPYSRGNRNAFKKVRGAGTDKYSQMLSQGYTGPNSSLGGTPGVSLGRNYNAKSQGPVEVKQLNNMLGRVGNVAAAGLGYVADYAKDYSDYKKRLPKIRAAAAEEAEAAKLLDAKHRVLFAYGDTSESNPYANVASYNDQYAEAVKRLRNPEPPPSLPDPEKEKLKRSMDEYRYAWGDRSSSNPVAVENFWSDAYDDLAKRIPPTTAPTTAPTTVTTSPPIKDEAGSVVAPRSKSRGPRKSTSTEKPPIKPPTVPKPAATSRAKPKTTNPGPIPPSELGRIDKDIEDSKSPQSSNIESEWSKLLGRNDNGVDDSGSTDSSNIESEWSKLTKPTDRSTSDGSE